MAKSNLERAFLFHLRAFAPHLPQPEAEYRFASPRRWRFDFAWVEEKVAVEIEGGLYHQGRHNRAAGYEADCEKYNQAALDGWLLLRFTGKQLSHNPKAVINTVIIAINRRIGYDVERCPNCGEAIKIMRGGFV